MKKVFILATLISTSAFGFEYGTPEFNQTLELEYKACIKSFGEDLINSGTHITPDVAERLQTMCNCMSYCVTDNLTDVSYIYDKKSLEKGKKILNKCADKCIKMMNSK